jgi:hypothetical protein
MENLGVASPKVRIISSLPNIGNYKTKTSFDVSASSWEQMQNSPLLPPLLTEAIIDPGESFSALIPSKRIKWINNYRATGTSIPYEGEPHISWTEILADKAKGSIMESIIPEFSQYEKHPPSYASESIPESYLGPIWDEDMLSREPDPNDELLIDKSFLLYKDSIPESTETNDETSTTEDLLPRTSFMWQTRSLDGMWWGVHSNSFLSENMPFWFISQRMRPPTSSDKDTLLVISLGLTSKDQRFDILLSLNNKPRIIDWLGGNSETGTPISQKEFDIETSRLFSTDSYIKIGVMTVAGRLVVIVNGEVLTYTRVDKSKDDSGGTLLECKIAPGPIAIYGTNAEIAFNVSPMTFAPLSLVPIMVPILSQNDDTAETESKFMGVNSNSEPEGSVCHLPTPPANKEQIYGCDCYSFSGDGGSASPSGFGMHQKGYIDFSKADAETYSALATTEFFILKMKPSDTQALDETIIKNGGCPYFFRIKGIHIKDGESPDSSVNMDITNFVQSISETVTAPDYYHSKKSLTVSFYDMSGAISNALRSNQSGIIVEWGWDNNTHKTFTGVITNISTTQKAGDEVGTIQAEDYMYILKNTPIVNSPFYDGMVAYYVIKDLAERASCDGFQNKWERTDRFFLPAGYSFSEPKMRYESKQKIFECIMDVVKRFEAFVYFDEDGRLVVTKLPGGLFSSQIDIEASFSSSDIDADGFIIEEKQVETDYNSTVNAIVAMTLERDTRNAVLYTRVALGQENKLLFKKLAIYKQAALGELSVCRAYTLDLAQRVFYPIVKTRWKTASSNYDLKTLSFVTVDGQPFRVMSIKRTYSAESNDFTTSYEGEWLGGSLSSSSISSNGSSFGSGSLSSFSGSLSSFSGS